MDSCHCVVKHVFMPGHQVDRRDPQIVKHTWSLQHQRQDNHTRQKHSNGYIQLKYRTSKVGCAIRMYIDFKNLITPYETTLGKICHLLWWWLLVYIMLDFGCGLCGDFAVTDLFVAVSAGTCFWFCCHWCGVPCGIDYSIWLSFCADPQLLHTPVTGTVAVDAPLAGCKRTVWASLGPTHRYFIDVWQQGQWANAPAGDWSCLSPEKEESGRGLSLTRQSRVGFHSLSWKGEAIPRCRFVMNFSCLFNALCVWLALHVDDGSLLGLCVLSPHLCHQSSVL